MLTSMLPLTVYQHGTEPVPMYRCLTGMAPDTSSAILGYHKPMEAIRKLCDQSPTQKQE